MDYAHTNLYSDYAKTLLEDICCTITRHGSGISPTACRRFSSFSHVGTEPNGNITFGHEADRHWSSYSYKTERYAKEHLAAFIKAYVYAKSISYRDAWKKRDDTDITLWRRCTERWGNDTAVGYSVRELRFIYEHLLNRKNLGVKYPSELIAKIVGTEKDPILSQMEETRRQEIKAIETRRTNEKEAAYRKMQDACTAFNREQREIYDAALKEIESKADADIKEINESLSLMNVAS